MQRNTPVLLITIVLGVLALGATAFMLMPHGGPAAPPPPAGPTPTPTPSTRWVASRDIPPRTAIDASMLEQKPGAGPVPTGAITSLDQVSGEITNAPISKGSNVLLSSFTNSLQRVIPANIPIPTGYRGVAIWVDPNQTAASLVDVGDHVDVVATHRLTWDKAPHQYVIGAVNFTTGRTIGQNLLVLGVDKSINAPAPTPTPVPGAPAQPVAAPTPVPAAPAKMRVLLAAKPDIAESLVAANDQGVLHVIIRNPADDDEAAVQQKIEYPSRVYTVKDATPATPKTAREPIPMPTFVPMPTVSPVPVASLTPLPVEPVTKEITVIRGTEKTRVLVPQR